VQAAEQVQQRSDMRPLKEIAMSRLKLSSALIKLILSEPDYLPTSEARIKYQLFAKLLYAELAAP